MHSIRLKMTTVTIAAIITTVLVLGGIGIVSIGSESDRSSVENMQLISQNTQLKLDAHLSSIEQSVNMAIRIARTSLNDPDIQYLGTSGTPEQVEKLDAALAVHCADVERALSSIASSTSGVVTYYYCINGDYGSNEHGFFWSRVGEEAFVKQPPLISSELDKNDIEHTTWYYTPFKTSAPVWVGPYKAHYLGERWTVSYVTPIFHQGFIVGVLGMDIPFDTIIEQAESVEVYESGFAFLMDRDGNVLYHPGMDMSGNAVLLDEGLSPEILRRRNTDDMLVRYTRNGEPWQLAFSALNNYFKVAVTAPVSEITAYQRQQARLILSASILILALFTVLSLLLMNRLTKPLVKLTAASRRLMSGDYDVELDYHRNDEVGILTKAFRQMRDHMKLYIRDLNNRAFTDAMTGVKNKGSFNAIAEQLNAAILASGDETPQFAVAMFDCNGLKQINDVYGHDHGDLFLKKSCGVICKVFAHSPVFRLGGDEFGVLLQGEDYEHRDALFFAFDSMAYQINSSAAQPWERVSISKGIADFRPGQDENVEQVLNRADESMYRDKRKHRDRSA